MRKELSKEIEIPEGVEVSVNGNEISVKGKEGTSKKKFEIREVVLEKKGNKIIIGNKNSTKREKKMINTLAAHITNMVKGVQEKFEYKLKVCFNHFPVTVQLGEGEVIIKNFLGEKTPRKAKIPSGAEVKIEKEIITVKSFDKEIAGQAAANLEKATNIRLRDRRTFQDGIFITKKCGKEI